MWALSMLEKAAQTGQVVDCVDVKGVRQYGARVCGCGLRSSPDLFAPPRNVSEEFRGGLVQAYKYVAAVVGRLKDRWCVSEAVESLL